MPGRQTAPPVNVPPVSQTTKPAPATNIRTADQHNTSGASPLDKISLKINEKIDSAAGKTASDEQVVAEKPAAAFAYERFVEIWEKIALTYKDNSPALFMAMTKNKPVRAKDELIEVFTDNAIQLDLVREKKPEILKVLHAELNNYKIDIIPKISASKKKEIAYLPAEKLQKLIKKNPAVEKLKNTFGLDLDY